jgi:hypothetical protein
MKKYLVEYEGLFGKESFVCKIIKEFNEEFNRFDKFFIDIKTNYKIPYFKKYVKKIIQ